MSFDSTQEHHQSLREILGLRAQQVLVWAGAGISASAQLPTWPALKDQLIEVATKELDRRDEKGRKILSSQIALAVEQADYWLAFQHLKEALGQTTFRQSIRTAFQCVDDALTPKAYRKLWEVGVKGILTTNIDRLASRAYADVYGGEADLCDFVGNQAGDYISVLKTGSKFVANLHGTLANENSWVFTRDDIEKLFKPAYKAFIQSCLISRTILFVGVSPDDYAVAEHFRFLRDNQIDIGKNYWLTHRNDIATHDFAEKSGLLRIHYNLRGDGDDRHAEVGEFIDDIIKYHPKDTVPPIVVPNQRKERNLNLPDANNLATKDAEEIRELLNKEAVRILSSNDPNKVSNYERFIEEYDDCIYRSWYVNVKVPRNVFFGYKVTGEISQGGFGKVYDAVSTANERVAIKVLHERVREDRAMLDSFRRGVQAMQLLNARKVSGVVPYRESWELPAATVMDYIDGYNLEQAVESGFVKSWDIKLRIARRLVEIIRSAHMLPEHVLHRDVRPANVMLKGFYSPEQREEWDLIVLDFDLCWHRDAVGSSINADSIAQGYHAPEQAGLIPKVSRRSALVDSYGVGMTLYFMCSGKHPLPQQVQHKGWNLTLRETISAKRCQQWTSLPNRFGRLILWTTEYDQSLRWDLTRVLGEIEILSACLQGDAFPMYPDVIAEEIAARCPRIGIDGYEWKLDTLTAYTHLPTGFEVQIHGNLSNRSVDLRLEWSNSGERSFESVRKYILPSADKVVARLKSGGWNVDVYNKNYNGLSIFAQVNVTERAPLDLNKLTRSLAEAIASLELK